MHDLDLSAPHTLHCLADGNVMVSSMGNAKKEAKGSFFLIDTKEWKVKGTSIDSRFFFSLHIPINIIGCEGLWSEDSTNFGYDFWYQPRRNVMVRKALFFQLSKCTTYNYFLNLMS